MGSLLPDDGQAFVPPAVLEEGSGVFPRFKKGKKGIKLWSF